MNTPLKIYIGWDSREDIAYQVARQSILDNTSIPVEIHPLKQFKLRRQGLYTRERDTLASTEFTFTRFLVPELNEFQDWALFIDCDFVFRDDIAKLVEQIDDKYAIMCAQHDYTPPEGVKMDGKQQLPYPRKNWSSMMLINCAHPSNQRVTADFVNNPDHSGAYLHRFTWLRDEEIGEVSHEWNWLVGWYKEPKDGVPKVLHYTEGGPWFENYEDCEYAGEWYKYKASYLQACLEEAKQPVEASVDDLSISPQKKSIVKNLLSHLVDPNGNYFGITQHKLLQEIKDHNDVKVAAISSSGGINYEKKGHSYDPFLTTFIQGSNGRISTWEDEKNSDAALVIRGLGGGSRKAIKHCWDTNRNFYAIDTGYFGNGKHKKWHRVTKNELQHTGPIVDRPDDRLKKIGYNYKEFTAGSKILICPPSNKVMQLWGQPTPEEWVEQVIAELKEYTDRPIEVRLKPNRSARVNTDTMEDALANDVHCMVTYNSIAATEALMNGKPAIALGPNAAQVLCNTSLSEVENLNIPTRDEMYAFMKHLSYCQFTGEEMSRGYAWAIVNGEKE